MIPKIKIYKSTGVWALRLYTKVYIYALEFVHFKKMYPNYMWDEFHVEFTRNRA